MKLSSKLEHEGFVTRYPNRGTIVTQLTSEEVRQILQVRLPLEMLAIKLAKKNINPTHVRSIGKAIEKMKKAFGRRSAGEFADADYALHETVWKMAGNQELLKILKSLCSRLFAIGISQDTLSGRKTLRTSLDLHASLAESLVHDEVETCQENMRKHMEYFWEMRDVTSSRNETSSTHQEVHFS